MDFKYEYNNKKLFYSHDDVHPHLIGHLRFDNGRSGNEFWSTWWPDALDAIENNDAFKSEFDHLVNELIETHIGSRKIIREMIHTKCPQILDSDNMYYGFLVWIEHYAFCVRVTPCSGMYNYIYCYENRTGAII